MLVGENSGDEWCQVRAITQFILLLLLKTVALPGVTHRSV